jgi:acyl-CoA synthetase (NDP forming)
MVQPLPPADRRTSDLHKLFYPDSVAIVGASPEVTGDRFPFFQALLKSGYQGQLYPVNPNYAEICGYRTFPSLSQIPGPVDLAIITLRAQNVPPIISGCVQKGVRFAVIFSSGFSESGNKVLEEEVQDLARQGPTRLIGPNCIGPYCPESGLSFVMEERPKEWGNVGYVSQSGGHSITYKTLAKSRGIQFDKILSIGNQCDLSLQEVLRYYAQDPKIEVICAYVEQAKSGQEFSQALREVARQKPLIIWKGGSTEPGARAALSHTGALASYSPVWQKSISQLGVISVDDLEEMADATFACLSISPPRGRRVGIVVAGGGSSVEMTDICARAGLEIPLLAEETQRKIAPLVPQANTSLKNPVDLGFFGFFPKVYSQAIRQASLDPNIDCLMLYQITEYFAQFNAEFDWVEAISREMAQIRQEAHKPLVTIIPPLEQENLDFIGRRQALIQNLRQDRIPVFPTVKRAAKVLYRLHQYGRFLIQGS